MKFMSFSQAARKHWAMVKFQNFTSPSCDSQTLGQNHPSLVSIWRPNEECCAEKIFYLKMGCHFHQMAIRWLKGYSGSMISHKITSRWSYVFPNIFRHPHLVLQFIHVHSSSHPPLRRWAHSGLTSPLPGTSPGLPQRLCREFASPSSGSNLGMLGQFDEFDVWKGDPWIPTAFKIPLTWMIWSAMLGHLHICRDTSWLWKTWKDPIYRAK